MLLRVILALTYFRAEMARRGGQLRHPWQGKLVVHLVCLRLIVFSLAKRASINKRAQTASLIEAARQRFPLYRIH